MKNNSCRRTMLLVVLASLFFAVVIPNVSEAIPAFARKYQMSCTTCHAPLPRLKAYGNEFAANGFVLKDQDAPRYFVDTGDDDLKLIRALPFAVRMDSYVQYQSQTGKDVDFSMPYNLKLLTGGSLGNNIAYYFYFFFSERGEVTGVEDAYIMFNNLFKKDLDLYLGQFQVCDPLFKRELRLTYEDYMIYKARVGDSSSANLAYDKGLMITLGLETGTDIIFELVNGNGLVPADEYRTFDDDKYKNFFGRISQSVTDFLRIGAIGYLGKEGVNNTNELWMVGGDATIGYKDKLELNLQYIQRSDDNPSFEDTAPADEIETKGGFAELIVMPKGDQSKFYGTLLYNKIDSDDDNIDYESFTAHVGYLLRTNFRLVAETTYDIKTEESRVMTGFITGF